MRNNNQRNAQITVIRQVLFILFKLSSKMKAVCFFVLMNIVQQHLTTNFKLKD